MSRSKSKKSEKEESSKGSRSSSISKKEEAAKGSRSSSISKESAKRSKSETRKSKGEQEQICKNCRCREYCSKCNKQLESSDYDSDGEKAANSASGSRQGSHTEGKGDDEGADAGDAGEENGENGEADGEDGEAEGEDAEEEGENDERDGSGASGDSKEARRRRRQDLADEKWKGFYSRQGIDTAAKPKSILIYKNGDEYDPGMIVKVTRKNYKNWVGFLDELTNKYSDAKTIHEIYTTDGSEIRHFRGLLHGGEYVAVSRKFRPVSYGKKKNRKWLNFMQLPDEKQRKLNSEESVKWYLEKKDFQPKLGDIWDDKDFDRKHIHDWED